MIHTTPDVAAMQNAVQQARARGVGYVFVSDQPASTAYSQLPASSFWNAELAAVQAP
jgi:ABC-type sugar transport system substrate-binding protein